MGESKRKRTALLAAPCRCMSNLPAGQCCFDGVRWHKKPSDLVLRELGTVGAVDGCYMADLRNCSGKLSREHLVSESVLEVIQHEGAISASGLPWQSPGATQLFGLNDLVAKCLCEKHNSALSPIDTAARNFFFAVKSCAWNEKPPGLRYVVSGHDVERWLLKTLKAMAVSKNLSRDGARLSGKFRGDFDLIRFLESPTSWPATTGMYCTMNAGHRILSGVEFQLTPFSSEESDEIGGLWANIQGIRFIMMIEPIDLNRNPDLRSARYRPSKINFDVGRARNTITLCWEDGNTHPTVDLLFERVVPS